MIQIANEFKVPAAPASVYDFLLRLEEVGGCIPGGSVGPAGEDGAHPAEIVVKLGPMRFNYRGTVRLEDRVDPERRATLLADVREARGQGSAKARMDMWVDSDGDGARVVTRTEVQLSGRAAAMGRGVIDDIATKMVEDMAACVTERLGSSRSTAVAPEPEHEPIRGLRLIWRVLWSKISRRSS